MDNPTCPKCGHYNAMLEQWFEGDYQQLTCRDCGYTEYPKDPPDPIDEGDATGDRYGYE